MAVPSPAGEGTATGNLLIVTESPLAPDDIEQVSVVATPVTRTVGYISAASWIATESEARARQDMDDGEQSTEKMTEREKRLKDSDVRGL